MAKKINKQRNKNLLKEIYEFIDHISKNFDDANSLKEDELVEKTFLLLFKAVGTIDKFEIRGILPSNTQNIHASAEMLDQDLKEVLDIINKRDVQGLQDKLANLKSQYKNHAVCLDKILNPEILSLVSQRTKLPLEYAYKIESEHEFKRMTEILIKYGADPKLLIYKLCYLDFISEEYKKIINEN